MGRTGVVPAAEGRIFALGVFPDDDHVDIVGLHVFQRAVHALEKQGGADVHVLVEAPAHFQEGLHGDVVGGDGGVPEGAHQDGVEGPQLLEVSLRGAAAVDRVQRRIPVETGVGDVDPQRVQHFPRLRDDFRPDTISWIKRDPVWHGIFPRGRPV